MSVRLGFLLLSIFFIRGAFSQDTAFIKYYLAGETIIPIHSQKFASFRSKVTFINLHDNEQTSVKAVEAYIAACGGTFVHLLNQEERFINICLKANTYTVDPNRIFTAKGRKLTLKLLSPQVDFRAQTEVANLAKQILKDYFDNSNLVVAVHNNTDSALSVISYQKDQKQKKHNGRTFINPDMDPDDFILTTNFSIFRRIKERNINVVWEKLDETYDDGSLSVYAGMHKIPYINIEAQHEHADEQLMMLNALDDIITEYGKKKTNKKNIKPTRLGSGSRPQRL